jgi:hypothetical protein
VIHAIPTTANDGRRNDAEIKHLICSLLMNSCLNQSLAQSIYTAIASGKLANACCLEALELNIVGRRWFWGYGRALNPRIETFQPGSSTLLAIMYCLGRELLVEPGIDIDGVGALHVTELDNQRQDHRVKIGLPTRIRIGRLRPLEKEAMQPTWPGSTEAIEKNHYKWLQQDNILVPVKMEFTNWRQHCPSFLSLTAALQQVHATNNE